ncbi:hypothetical protein D3C76_1540520 [compost metagenome]
MMDPFLRHPFHRQLDGKTKLLVMTINCNAESYKCCQPGNWQIPTHTVLPRLGLMPFNR